MSLINVILPSAHEKAAFADGSFGLLRRQRWRRSRLRIELVSFNIRIPQVFTGAFPFPPLSPGEGRGEGETAEALVWQGEPTSACPPPQPSPGGRGGKRAPAQTNSLSIRSPYDIFALDVDGGGVPDARRGRVLSVVPQP